ncbi:NADP-dependent aryl-alcohol dehydrogenase [Echinicola pacifica]|uniref:NADP-dependent aryl-alcohol dehydrogenase n=1 Tax=Echinicola pacifica TaxID=346377 RepID=A0A918PKX5_9BACT|nr:aldo/keto reductase [Echinicola pacifica]GGZ14677.1 NADP-dependent aryl-alcohol dehydrogenase [Echinicola pacifica]
MDKKKLGNTNLTTAPIVFGCNVFGWTLDENESFRMLDELVGMGLNTLDTADVYSSWVPGNKGGESETIIGKWLKQSGNRDKVNIITKVGSDMGQGHKDIGRKYIAEAVEASLRRLQIDHIDLYLTHWDDERTPVEETLGAYAELIKAGKVGAIGASNLSPERLQESLDASKKEGLPKYEVFQPEYNLLEREGYESGLAEICTKENLGVISYFSLASGFLTGKYRTKDDFDKSVRGGGMNKYLDERGLKILKSLDELAAKHSVSQAAIALGWLINSDLVTAPIASATKSSHLKAFREAISLRLETEDVELLDKASS